MDPIAPGQDLECIADPARAQVLLDPRRMRILALAREPTSATEIAGRLRLSRQRVNYHVRLLAEHDLLKRAGRLRKRNMFEQRYVASARSYLIVPSVLGPIEADWRSIPDTASAAYLLALSAQIQSDLARALERTPPEESRISTLSLKSQFRFESAKQRADFAGALRRAVVDAIARFSSPDEAPGGQPTPGPAYRLVLGCYPYAPRPEQP